MSVNDATGMWVDDGFSDYTYAKGEREYLQEKLQEALKNKKSYSGPNRRYKDETDYDRIKVLISDMNKAKTLMNTIVRQINESHKEKIVTLDFLPWLIRQFKDTVEIFDLLQKRIEPYLTSEDIDRLLIKSPVNKTKD